MQNRFGRFDTTSFQETMLSSGGGAVKRRAVFILGAKWIALVRGWWRDCVVGGMETRFQWRKAHNPSAKCEAFHIAPRLFFYVFVFDSIHDSATMHNLSALIFHWADLTLFLILWGDVGKKVMAPVQSRMGAIFGVTIYYFRFFRVRNYFIIFFTADWLPSV